MTGKNLPFLSKHFIRKYFGCFLWFLFVHLFVFWLLRSGLTPWSSGWLITHYIGCVGRELLYGFTSSCLAKGFLTVNICNCLIISTSPLLHVFIQYLGSSGRMGTPIMVLKIKTREDYSGQKNLMSSRSVSLLIPPHPPSRVSTFSRCLRTGGKLTAISQSVDKKELLQLFPTTVLNKSAKQTG